MTRRSSRSVVLSNELTIRREAACLTCGDARYISYYVQNHMIVIVRSDCEYQSRSSSSGSTLLRYESSHKGRVQTSYVLSQGRHVQYHYTFTSNCPVGFPGINSPLAFD